MTQIARQTREWGDLGEYQCFNLGFSWEFRCCLEQDCSPAPTRDVTTLTIDGNAYEFGEMEVPELTVGGKQVARSPERAVHRVQEFVQQEDPDVLVIESTRLLAELHGLADPWATTSNLDGVPASSNSPVSRRTRATDGSVTCRPDTTSLAG